LQRYFWRVWGTWMKKRKDSLEFYIHVLVNIICILTMMKQWYDYPCHALLSTNK
jgi:hypothetical protein